MVIPVFVFGYFVPGFLARISWEFGSSWIPLFDALWERVGEFMQVVADGAFAVYLAALVAPRANKAVAVAAALFIVIVVGVLLTISVVTDYYRGAPSLDVFWNVLLIVVTAIAGVVAAIYFITTDE